MINTSIAQAKTMFLESIKLPRSTNTVQTYRKALDAFSNMLVSHQTNSLDFPVADLTEDTVAHFADYMKDLSPATENLYLQVIKGFFEFLDAERLSKVNLSRVRMLIRQRARRASRETSQYPESDIRYLIDIISNLQSVSTAVDSNEVENLELRDMRDRALILCLPTQVYALKKYVNSGVETWIGKQNERPLKDAAISKRLCASLQELPMHS